LADPHNHFAEAGFGERGGELLCLADAVESVKGIKNLDVVEGGLFDIDLCFAIHVEYYTASLLQSKAQKR
jgi:hypothetical protein